jgi:hypothetical protein
MNTSLFFKQSPIIYIAVLMIGLGPSVLIGQSFSDSTQRKNIIKYDLSANLWYSNAYGLTYERLIKKNQTASITLGVEQISGITSRLNAENIQASEAKATGYKIAADYRFYLGKENRYSAPHGVYVGPYFSHHSFENKFDLKINGSNGQEQKGHSNGKFQFTNVGIQLGYQFLIGNRLSLDMTFLGTSLSYYKIKMNVDGNFDLSDSEINQELLDALKEKFPLLGDMIENGEIDQSGRINTWGLGYRYIIQVGYAFGGGRKKK